MNILIIPDKEYPLNHALLNNIFGKHFPAMGHQVYWLLLSGDMKNKYEYIEINGTHAYLVKKLSSKVFLLNKFYQYIGNAWSKRILSKIIKKHNIDVVFVRNELFAVFYSLLCLGRRKRVCAFYLGFPKPESALHSIEVGWSKDRLALRLYSSFQLWFRKELMKWCDIVFVMSNYWRNELITKDGFPASKVFSLPFGFNLPNAHDFDRDSFRGELGLSLTDKVLLYYGSIGPPRDVTILAPMLRLLVEVLGDDVKLLLVYGERQDAFVDKLTRRFIEHGVMKNVMLHPSVSHSEINKFILASDVGLSPIEQNHVLNVASPAKFIEMIGLGLPVASSSIPEQKDLTDLYGAGLSVPMDHLLLAEAVAKILRDNDHYRNNLVQEEENLRQQRLFANLAKKIAQALQNRMETNY